MKKYIYYIAVWALILFVSSSCSKEDEIVYIPTSTQTSLQNKALELLQGKWISEKVVQEFVMGGNKYTTTTLPDTLNFLTHFDAPKTFYAYNYLQGKEVEVFKAHGTCEFRMYAQYVDYKPLCYFYIDTDGSKLHLYHAESMMLCRTYPIRFESSSRFVYGSTTQGIPMYFNRIE